MTKRIAALLLACLFLLACAACGKQPAADPDGSEPSSAPAVSTEPGMDEIDRVEGEEPDTVIDIVTGEVDTKPQKDPASTDPTSPPAQIEEPGNGTTSGGPTTGPTTAPTGGAGSEPGSDPDVSGEDPSSDGSDVSADPDRDTMEGFRPWQ